MGAVGRVDVDQDRADLGGGVLRDRPLGAVRRPDADPVALRDAGARSGRGRARRRRGRARRRSSAARWRTRPAPRGRRTRPTVRSRFAPIVSSSSGGLGLTGGVGLHVSYLQLASPTRTHPAWTRPSSGDVQLLDITPDSALAGDLHAAVAEPHQVALEEGRRLAARQRPRDALADQHRAVGRAAVHHHERAVARRRRTCACVLDSDMSDDGSATRCRTASPGRGLRVGGRPAPRRRRAPARRCRRRAPSPTARRGSAVTTGDGGRCAGPREPAGARAGAAGRRPGREWLGSRDEPGGVGARGAAPPARPAALLDGGHQPHGGQVDDVARPAVGLDDRSGSGRTSTTIEPATWSCQPRRRRPGRPRRSRRAWPAPIPKVGRVATPSDQPAQQRPADPDRRPGPDVHGPQPTAALPGVVPLAPSATAKTSPTDDHDADDHGDAGPEPGRRRKKSSYAAQHATAISSRRSAGRS